MNTRHALAETALGQLTIVARSGEDAAAAADRVQVAADGQDRGDAITGLYFRHHIRRPAQQSFGPEVELDRDPLLAEAAAQLHQYLAGARREFELPFDAAGDAFRHAVWSMVAEIPFGETTTYGAIAQRLGDTSLAYRVGQAVGANPLCIFVPCHRVLGAGGKLTGYAGGLTCKQALLELEEPVQVAAARLF